MRNLQPSEPNTLEVLGLTFRIDAIDTPHDSERCCWSIADERITLSRNTTDEDRPELLRRAARLIAAELTFGPADTGGALPTPAAAWCSTTASNCIAC